MNPKTVVILVVLLLVAAAAFMATRPGDESSTDISDTTTGDVQLLPAKVLGNQLDAIDLGPDGFGRDAESSLSLMRFRGQWEVEYPGLFPAETRAIDELLETLAGLSGQITEEHYDKVEPIKPEDLIGVEGVIQADPPSLVLHQSDGPAWEITLGPRLGAGRAVLFIKTPDGNETTYHAIDTLHDYFEAFDPDVYYAKAFDPPLMPEVGRIEITTPDGQSVLVQDKGRWWIEHEAGRERALEIGLDGYTGINNYFNLFQAAALIEKQTHYPTNGMASFGLEKPLISARFIPLGEAPNEPSNGYEIHVGTPADPQDQTRYISNGYAGEATHPVFTVDTKFAIAFAQDAKAFRDPRIMQTPIALIKNIDIRLPEGRRCTIAFERGKLPALIEGNGRTTLFPDKTSSALRVMSNARASDYLPTDLLAWDLLASIKLVQHFEREEEIFSIFNDPMSKTENPTALIHRSSEPVALRVPMQSIAWLLDPMLVGSVDRD